ncbi:MAG: hypothetical protein M3Y87_03710 [Myxococcota bacterium]|nr:hypothetical protein [Myxococcota bacterium]
MSGAPELRHAALQRAGAMRDSRVAEVIRRAIVDVHDRAGEAWESSDGTVRAVDVRVAVDGHALGLCEAYPAVRDAVVEAITAEAPRMIGASVVDLTIVWGVRERAIEGGYREGTLEAVDRDDGEDVRRAVAGFLTATGAAATAHALTGVELDVGAREIDMMGSRGLAPSAIEPALAALFGRRMRVQVRRR